MTNDTTGKQHTNKKNIVDTMANIDMPEIDANAKKRAVNLAMAEFNAQLKEDAQKNNTNKRQGFWSWLRPTDNNNINVSRKSLMAILNNKVLYSGAATLSLALVGSFLFYQTDNPTQITISPEDIEELAVVKENASLSAQKKTDSDSISKAEAEVISSLVVPAPVEATNETAQVIASNVGKARASETLPKESMQLADTAMAKPQIPVAEAKRKQLVASAASPQVLSRAAPATFSAEIDRRVDTLPPQSAQPKGRDRFEHVEENPIKLVSKEPVSTFSVDVDTVSYSFIRRQLNQGVLPQKDAIRIEEMVNYFDYSYSLPESKQQPFKPSIIVQPSPWSAGKQLVHIGIKGYDIPASQQPRSNIVLLLDVSGSMNSADKLPLVKQSMNLLLNSLQADDTVAIVVYAGAAGKVLEPTPVKEKQKILDALARLSAGGSTAGGQGIKLAYELAEANFNKNSVNRIILATDGDFNVGINNREELKGFVERKREKGIFLSVLGFGQGNYHDHMMQSLAQNGNGIAAYIDSLSEAQKVLVDEATSTLFPIAKDVKLQLEFNPQVISEYRLIGYETRHLKQQDFNNDKVDAGDIGAGHSVTAIYEVTPVNSKAQLIDAPRYSGNVLSMAKQSSEIDVTTNKELGFLKIRYKLPQQGQSKLITQAIYPMNSGQGDISSTLKRDANFATAVAAFSQRLKGGKYIGAYSYDNIIDLAQANKGEDIFGYRSEFIQLVRKAKTASAL